MSDNHSEQVQNSIAPYLLQGRSGLLPALQTVQRQFGWLSELDAASIAHSLHVPLADVHGVIEFYSLSDGTLLIAHSQLETLQFRNV